MAPEAAPVAWDEPLSQGPATSATAISHRAAMMEKSQRTQNPSFSSHSPHYAFLRPERAPPDCHQSPSPTPFTPTLLQPSQPDSVSTGVMKSIFHLCIQVHVCTHTHLHKCSDMCTNHTDTQKICTSNACVCHMCVHG